MLEDHLPWVSSLELVKDAQLFAPDTKLVVLAEDGRIAEDCMAAGATAAYGRRVDLAEVRDQCVDVITGS